MKSLLLIRHAKSSWDTPSQNDFDRPLNDRGRRDAPAMAQRLFEKNIAIDLFISSPAKRALATAKYFADAYGKKQKDILQFEELYDAPYDVFYDVITKINDDHSTIAIFAHNPGITAFANDLSTTRIDNMPTCGIFALHAETKHWKGFEAATKSFWFFDSPKEKE